MKCERCNNILPDDSVFCSYCGNKIEKPQEPQAPKCEKCGNTLPLDSEFCHFCGNQISQSPVEEKQTDTIEKESSDAKFSKQVKQKYCSKCGGVINNSTKVCEGCGKQYFNLSRIFNKKNTLPIILSVILLISIIANICLAVDLAFYQDVAWTRLQGVWEWQEKYENLYNQNRFYEKHAVVVSDDGTNRYHKYGCSLFDDSKYWIFNIEYAEWKGYQACPRCCE